MKFRTTQKSMKEHYTIYSVGYCNANALLYGEDAIAYNSGVYGWNCDYYYVDGICICTGYRPHGISTKAVKTSEYEKAAEEIRNNWDLSYDEKCERIAAIRSAWIAAIKAV